MEFARAFREINGNALLEKWESFKNQLRGIMVNQFNVQHFKTGWNNNIEDVLVLLKLLPSKQIGRNVISSTSTFNSAIENLIQYMPV